MNSEAQIIISFLFKRSGKDELKNSEIYLPLSLELGWFSARESRDFVTYAIEQKLLLKKGILLTPSFDVEKIAVPVGFYPSKKSFAIEKTDVKEEEEKNVIDVVVQRVVEKTKKNPENILEKIRQIKREKNILTEIAALLAAKEYEVPIDDCFEFVENKIF